MTFYYLGSFKSNFKSIIQSISFRKFSIPVGPDVDSGSVARRIAVFLRICLTKKWLISYWNKIEVTHEFSWGPKLCPSSSTPHAILSFNIPDVIVFASESGFWCDLFLVGAPEKLIRLNCLSLLLTVSLVSGRGI